nr:oligosaccharide flippase family protein [Bradyrhizobium cosmicum]
MGVRGAFLWASFGRYLVMSINLAVAIVVARLIGPAAFGVSVLGSSVFVIAEAFREFGGGAYLIQQKGLTPKKVRTSITISILVSVAISLCLYFSAGFIANFYGLTEVGRYIKIATIGYLLGSFVFPVFALLNREMEFRTFALINILMALSGGLTSIWLAKLGFGFLSLAWAATASAASGSILCLLLYADRSIYRPSLSEWRSVMGFGAFDSAAALVSAIGEYAPYLIIGRTLDSASVGLAQRAVLISVFPERVILAGVGAVMLPIFSQSVRDKSDTKAIYLSALELITAVHWPCLVLLAALSTPLISLLLGPQWLDVAPLVRILCLAAAFSFPWALQYPVLVAVGAVRKLPFLVAVQAVLNTAAVALVAGHGLLAISWCLVGIVPLNALIAVAVVRRYLDFGWGDFFGALRKSILLSILSSLGPTYLIFTHGGPDSLSIEAGALGVSLSLAGWGIGLVITHHPLLQQLVRACVILRRKVAVQMS